MTAVEWSGFAVFRDLPLQCDLTDEGEADPESSLFHSTRREIGVLLGLTLYRRLLWSPHPGDFIQEDLKAPLCG